MEALQDPQVKQFVVQEQQRQRFQQLVHTLTDQCWDKCMGSVSNKLESKTQNCIVNCVDRFIDTTNFVVNRLESAPMTAMANEKDFS